MTRIQRLKAGAFWMAVLLVLPGCFADRSGVDVPRNFDDGLMPRSQAIFCDIERERRCIETEQDRIDASWAVRFSEAAVALAEGRSSIFAIDDRSDIPGKGRAKCGEPGELVVYEGPFPHGLKVCLNCSRIGPGGKYVDANEACRTRCYDFYGTSLLDRSFRPSIPPAEDVSDWCDKEDRSKVSTHTLVDGCTLGVCTASGFPLAGFVDPRSMSEAVVWTDMRDADPGGADNNDLTRRTDAVESRDFDAGAISTQWIMRGDAWVEFSWSAQSVIVGLTEGPGPLVCPPLCPDPPFDESITFGILLDYNGQIFVSERGTLRFRAGVEPFGTSTTTDRFRVRLRDNADGTASVSYAQVRGTCLPGTWCSEWVFYESTLLARYPLRVDASLAQDDAKITNVRVVRMR